MRHYFPIGWPRFLTGIMVLSCVFAAYGTQAPAQNQTADTGFTFRRVPAPGQGSSGNRITVQIDPQAQAEAWALGTEAADEARAQGAARNAARNASGGASGDLAEAQPEELPYSWFWGEISPALAASGPGRLEKALNWLGTPPSGETVPAPRLADLQSVVRAHSLDILRATIGTEVSPALVLAVIGIESGGRSDAVSSAGAAGLMQLMPATAERFGVEDRGEAAQNIAGGVAYLDWLMKEFDGDPLLVLAAYNSGENAVRNNSGVPPYAETRAYVPKVLAAWQVARGLCVTPPQLASDGCVFNTDRVGTAARAVAGSDTTDTANTADTTEEEDTLRGATEPGAEESEESNG